MKLLGWWGVLCLVFASNAMNIASLELTWEKQQGLQYRINAIAYVYDYSPIDEKLTVIWGDNTQGWLYKVSEENVSNRYKKIVYAGTHTYAGSGYFTVGVQYINRPPSVGNIFLSHQEKWYVEAKILVSTMLGNLQSPSFLFPPEEKVCVAETVGMNLQAIDVNGDELRYYIQPCYRGQNEAIQTYTYPPSFIGFSIDEQTGMLVWKPSSRGLYAYVVRVEKYRQGVLLGTIVRDAIVQVASCPQGGPSFDVFNDTCIVVGEHFLDTIHASIPTNDSLRVSLITAEQFQGNSPHFQNASGIGAISSPFSWDPACEQVRKIPYTFTFTVESKPGNNGCTLLNDFNTTLSPFSASSSATIGAPCGKSWDSTYHVWFGKDSTAPRFLKSPFLDLSGGEYLLLFDMRFEVHTGEPNTSCEGPDEPDEGVYVQCSSDGIHWTTLVYFNPALPVDNPGHLESLIRWNNYAIFIPTDFLIPHVQFRWLQTDATNNDYDHWGIDNVRLLKLSPYANITEVRKIDVIAPPVDTVSATVQGNAILLNWDTASCLNARGYFIYRKIDPSAFSPLHCESGVPESLGYTCIDTLYDIHETSYVDDNHGQGLPVGNTYCYRVTYWFDDGSESKASQEVCASIAVNAPVITKVSVAETSSTEGKIIVSWNAPLDFDTNTYQPPYRYAVYRSTNQTSETVVAYVEGFSSNSFVDSLLDTESMHYRYRIGLEAANGSSTYQSAGFSAPAWSVFLHLQPESKAMRLFWDVNVPWAMDYTVIYRWNETSHQFDSIGISNAFTFLDTGLLNNTMYCYKVETVGHYSHPLLPHPLRNFSQEACDVPKDTEPPCPLILSVHTHCMAIQNELRWQLQDSCNYDDFKVFYIWFKPALDLPWSILDSIFSLSTSTYFHYLSNTVAGCYAITAKDSSGNESSFSNMVCVDIDSCSLYSLPNVFTPNGDGYNDFYRPFPYDFVEKIDLKVYNRWGVKVYSTTDPEIGWDGTCTTTGKPCSEGVYYYICDVYEWTLKGLRKRTLHGTIHLYR
jgi:gliding motility-associated-like protein